MGSTLLKHQRRGSPKEICNSLHACNGIPCPKHYTPIRKFETIFMSRLHGNALYFFLDSYLCTSGVEKHNDDAKRKYFYSNQWDAPADIMMTEYRLKMLQEYSREGYTLSRTLLTGMKVELRPSDLNVEKQYKGQQSLKVNYM